MKLWPSKAQAERPAHHAQLLQERPRAELNGAKETILDELEIATVDRTGRRFKEREIIGAMKTVSRL